MAVVSYEKQDGVAIIRYTNPKVLNPQTAEQQALSWKFLEQANADPEIGAIVVTGTGRAFCAGADIENLFAAKIRGDSPYDDSDNILGGLGSYNWYDAIADSKPIVIAFNGMAVGGGATAWLSADVLIGCEKSAFIFPFAKVGIVPELGSSHWLAARVGFGRASDWMLTGRTISAEEAERAGMITQLVPSEELEQHAIKTAAGLAKLPAYQLAESKRLIRRNFIGKDTVNDVYKSESDALREALKTDAHKQAWLSRRGKTDD
jgi:enoyl-CoA hydratase/carnithine racemase